MAAKRRRLKFHPEAALEANDAAEWYAERSRLASDKFKQALRHAEDQVKLYPEAWNPYYHGTRCFRLHGFPYALVYVQRSGLIAGLAVAHLKRRPGYWRKRLEDELP
jgi:hypothetical protein